MASFKDGKVMGDGLRLLYSTDGLRWEALPSADKVDRGYGDDIVLAREDIPNARVFRDPSLLWHGGFFHLVFTSELCVYQVRCMHCRQCKDASRMGSMTDQALVKGQTFSPPTCLSAYPSTTTSLPCLT